MNNINLGFSAVEKLKLHTAFKVFHCRFRYSPLYVNTRKSRDGISFNTCEEVDEVFKRFCVEVCADEQFNPGWPVAKLLAKKVMFGVFRYNTTYTYIFPHVVV